MQAVQYQLTDVSKALRIDVSLLNAFIRKQRKLPEDENNMELISEYEIKMFMTRVLHVDDSGTDTLTNWWLQNNDPYYRDDRKNKRKKVEYSYETCEQQRRRKRQEFPFCALYLQQLYDLRGKQVDVDDYIKAQIGSENT